MTCPHCGCTMTRVCSGPALPGGGHEVTYKCHHCKTLKVVKEY